MKDRPIKYSHEIERELSKTRTWIGVYLVKDGRREPLCFAFGYVTLPHLPHLEVEATVLEDRDLSTGAIRAMAAGLLALAEAMTDEVNNQLRVKNGLTP